jgi:transcriptional regulator with XRE-family HTH domain
MESSVTFGEWVKEQREARGLRPAECARRAGLSAQRWSNLEAKSKRPYRDTCVSVAKGLGMLLEDVMAAAGLTVRSDLGRRLEQAMCRLPLTERQKVEQWLAEDVERYINLLSPYLEADPSLE